MAASGNGRPAGEAKRADALMSAGTVTLGERGVDGHEGWAPLDEAVRPEAAAIVRGVGRLLAVLGELLDTPTTTAWALVGGVEVGYRALHHPDGAIQIRRFDGQGGARAIADAEPGHALAVPVTTPALVPGSAQDGGPRERGGRWERGIKAARSGAHADALRQFEQEANELAEQGSYARAALSYRCASGQADQLGQSDQANRLLRLAGEHYLNAAEMPQASHRAARQAYEMAAKCFLQAGNLPMAETSISRAIMLDEVLG